MEIITQSVLYALPTRKCNLSCSHCDVKNINDNYNEQAFIDKIKNFNGTVILFGGEPSLYKERLLKAVGTSKINSITTNLIELDDELLNVYKDINIGTSWNKIRFTGNQYNIWLNNLKKLEEHNIPCTVLITLTEELINDDIEDFFVNIIKNLDLNYKAVDRILFEQLIDANKTKDFYDRVDEWLCKIHILWEKHKIKIENSIVKKLKHWIHDCSETYTLYPDGSIRQGCPHNPEVKVASECLACEAADKCRPCRLQQFCTYPKKLAMLTKINY